MYFKIPVLFKYLKKLQWLYFYDNVNFQAIFH